MGNKKVIVKPGKGKIKEMFKPKTEPVKKFRKNKLGLAFGMAIVTVMIAVLIVFITLSFSNNLYKGDMEDYSNQLKDLQKDNTAIQISIDTLTASLEQSSEDNIVVDLSEITDELKRLRNDMNANDNDMKNILDDIADDIEDIEGLGIINLGSLY